VGPQTVDLGSFTAPQIGPLAVLAGTLVLVGLWRESTARIVAGGTLIALGSLATSAGSGMNQWFWQVHGPLLALLALPVMLDDSLARQLRRQTWKAVAALAIVAAAFYPWVLPGLAPAALTSYLALLLAISLGHWQRVREFGPLGGAIVTLAASALGPGRYGYQWLDQSPIGRGKRPPQPVFRRAVICWVYEAEPSGVRSCVVVRMR
jgi:hypothetical protein